MAIEPLTFPSGSTKGVDDAPAATVSDGPTSCRCGSYERVAGRVSSLPAYPFSPGSKEHDGASEAAQPTPKDAELLREQVLSMLLCGDMTADELALTLRKSVLSVRPRVSELYAQGLIYKTQHRRLNASGCSATVWTTRRPTA